MKRVIPERETQENGGLLFDGGAAKGGDLGEIGEQGDRGYRNELRSSNGRQRG